MSKRGPKSQKLSKGTRTSTSGASETQTSDAATVAWTVSVTTVFLCNAAAVAAHLYARAHPELPGPAMLASLLLFSAAVIGAISLLLLPVVYRYRRVPPPAGLAVFGACVAAAPILALVVHLVR